MPTNNSVLVALSGGVDSTVCVHLLKKQGFSVRAVVMRMSELHDDTVEAAKASAEALSVPLTVLDLRKEFEENVISYFLREYSRGRTPNPCVVCNPTVKFHHLIEEADRQDCAYAATGHYARITFENGLYRLKCGASLQRDQSYMLYRLTQRELSRLLLPLAELAKPEVREVAAELSLAAASKPDSQENCFIAGNDYSAYIEQRLGKSAPGEFIAPDGTVCGRHDGIIHYTVGQRKGLGIALGRPVFVKRIDTKENRIYLADAGQDAVEEAMVTEVTTTSGKSLREELQASQCLEQSTETATEEAYRVTVKIRSTAVPVNARITPLTENRLHVTFDEPQRAVAGGQSLVIYDGDTVLGGGFLD